MYHTLVVNSQLCLSFRTLSAESGSTVSHNGYTVTELQMFIFKSVSMIHRDLFV